VISDQLRQRVRKIALERIAAKERGEPIPSVAFVVREIVNVEPVTSRYNLKEVRKSGKMKK
jgi:hypothetical protein